MRRLQQHTFEVLEDVGDPSLAGGRRGLAVEPVGGEELPRAGPIALRHGPLGRGVEELDQDGLRALQVIADGDEQDPLAGLRDRRGGRRLRAPPEAAGEECRERDRRERSRKRQARRREDEPPARPRPLRQARRDPAPDLPAVRFAAIGQRFRLDQVEEPPDPGHPALAGDRRQVPRDGPVPS
jgi:hypothetical protein